MKAVNIIEALSYIKDEYIQDAAPGKYSGRRAVIATVAVAACAAILLTVLWPSPLPVPDLPEPGKTEVPMITSKLEHVSLLINTGGGGGYLAYDASDFETIGPWTEDAELSTLPVYQNLWVRNGAGVPPQMDSQEEAEIIAQVKEQLGPLAQFAEVELEDGHATNIRFTQIVVLPKEYRLLRGSTYMDACVTGRYLLDAFGYALGMEDPVMDIRDGTRDLYGRQCFEVYFYENAGTLDEGIVNACLKSVRFSIDEEGNLWGMRIWMTDLSEEVGQFPAISLEEAKELLYQGYFICKTGFGRITADQTVEMVQLVYPTNGMDEYYIPYYEFVIESDESHNIGKDPELKAYDSYYVPAVEMQYLEGMNGYGTEVN